MFSSFANVALNPADGDLFSYSNRLDYWSIRLPGISQTPFCLVSSVSRGTQMSASKTCFAYFSAKDAQLFQKKHHHGKRRQPSEERQEKQEGQKGCQEAGHSVDHQKTVIFAGWIRPRSDLFDNYASWPGTVVAPDYTTKMPG
jgi:hypothetical protein